MNQNGVLEIPCLGKPFKLGMLYDCRIDRLIPNATLWNDDILSNTLAFRHSKQSQCQIYKKDSLDEKMEMLGAHTNIKLSFLSGLVEAPSYLNFFEDRASPNQQARVTLKYESIDTFEELDFNILKSLPYEDFDEQTNATHFVSGVSYGSNTLFVFDRHVKRNESYASVSSHMELLISSLPDISINKVGLVEIPEVHKENAKKLNCTVYGDNPISNSSLTFDEAVKSFVELRNNSRPVAPIKAFLQPLSSLDIEAARYFNDLSDEAILQVTSTMETFSGINTRLNDLTKTKAFLNFSSIEKKITKFRAMNSQYKNTLKKNLSTLLPRVRGGDADKDELMKVLKDVASTPFSQAFMSSWVDKAEKEIKLLSTYLDYFKDIQFAFEPEELESVIHSLEHERVVCFSFMIQDVQDEQLEAMHTFLRNGQFQQKPAKQRNWYEDQAIINDLKTKAKRFTSFFKTNVNNNSTKCVVTNIVNESKDDKIAVIEMFQDGQPIESESIAVPSQTSSLNARVDDINAPFKSTGMLRPSISTNIHSRTASRNTSNQFSYSSEHERLSELEARGKQEGCSHVDQQRKMRESLQEQPQSTKEHDRKHGFLSSSKSYSCAKKGKETTAVERKIVDGGNSVSSLYDETTSDAGGRLDHTAHIKTQATSSLAELMRLQSEMIDSGNSPGSVFIYKIPTTETMRKQTEKLVKKCLKDPREGSNRYVRGRPQEKVLMVMGATGAGKSTLINGMVNYIMGVEWEDQFRFKLIDESSASQAHSVTKEITAYTIYPMEGSALDYVFTIIDTPGYGDTEGLKRDITITKQIKKLFSLGGSTGVEHLDGIGFVTQSSLPRLTPTQTYIFDSILSIFGKDMGNNIFMMVTFADGQPPPVLTAVDKAKISYQEVFKFNNSALFAPNANCDFDAMFWQMGKASFEKFFRHFQSTRSVRLEQTNKVLEEREQLENLVEGLNPQIKKGLAKLEEMRHEKMALQKHESQIERNKDFEFTVPTMKTKQIDLRGTERHTTTCLKCNFTCHKGCKIADDKKKRRMCGFG